MCSQGAGYGMIARRETCRLPNSWLTAPASSGWPVMSTRRGAARAMGRLDGACAATTTTFRPLAVGSARGMTPC